MKNPAGPDQFLPDADSGTSRPSQTGSEGRIHLDFLELGEEHSERQLERALIARIEDFLRAMGGKKVTEATLNGFPSSQIPDKV